MFYVEDYMDLLKLYIIYFFEIYFRNGMYFICCIMNVSDIFCFYVVVMIIVGELKN